MNGKTTLVADGPFVLPDPAAARPRRLSVPELAGPFVLPESGETARKPPKPPTRARYAAWSDADDRAKGRNPRDQLAAGRPVGKSYVVVYPAQTGRDQRIFVLQDFKIDGASLRSDHRAYLAEVASWMREGGRWRVFAEAHASRTGSRRHDDVLSEDRYLVARAYLETELQRRGVDLSRVRIAGEGVGFRHSPLPGEDPKARSVYEVVQPDPSPNPPQSWPPRATPVAWPPVAPVPPTPMPPTPVPIPPAPPSPADPRLSRAQVMRWFVGGTDSQGQNLGRVTSNNRVLHLIRGRSAFDAMMRAMRTANAPGHFIYVLGWFMSDGFAVAGGTTLQQLFATASQAGVAVRAMLWDQPLTQNSAEVDHINALSRGAAILDNRTLNLGAHHQKILIVNGTEGVYAFSGGVDFNEDRLANPDRKPGYPMHDVHCQIQGPAAFDLLQIFHQRWNDHPDHVNLDRRKGVPPTASAPAPISSATDWVQIGRTYGNGNAHRGIDSDRLGTRPLGYTFLRGRTGEQTVKAMLLHAISQARRFIYMEDQYLVSLEIRDALIKALPNVSHITILIPDGSISDLPQGNFRRREFIAPLRKAGGSKVRVYHPHPPRDPFGYVHAKMWVFDDEFAIIGSANCNRRGYTHDGEAVAGICDEGNGIHLRFAHRLREDLWALHLNVSTAAVRDPIASAALWLRPVGAGHVEAHNEHAGIERIHTDVSWNNAVDPDGS